jgi:hypothetical protein
LLAFTYFHHRRLHACFRHHRLPLHASPHHRHLFLLACSRLLLSSLLLQVPSLFCHLLVCFIVYMFELWAHPPCLVLLPFSICARGGT